MQAIHPGNRTIASNMLRKINRLTTGSPAPDFMLADKNDKLVSLKDFKGRYQDKVDDLEFHKINQAIQAYLNEM